MFKKDDEGFVTKVREQMVPSDFTYEFWLGQNESVEIVEEYYPDGFKF